MKLINQPKDRQDACSTLEGRFVFRRRWLVLIAAVVLSCAFGGWKLLSFNSRLNRQSAIAATLEWACLGPLPDDAENVQVNAVGSVFTRELTITFQSQAGSVSAWISQSAAMSKVAPVKDAEGWMLYKIKPCGGAAHAELQVSPDNTRVKIHSVWS